MSDTFEAGEDPASSLRLVGDVAVAELKRLHDKLVATTAEIARLRDENERLRSARPAVPTALAHRSQRAPRLFPSAEEAPVGVDGSSPPEDKIRLFRSLFAGRVDVYAQRWESPSTKKSGWSPVTLGGSRRQVYRRYAPMDDAVVGAGVYWKPVFWVPEDAVECWLLNARHMRNVPGRKTDMADAEWICRLMEHGLVRASFVPPPEIRELRDLTRFRKTRIEERTREAQRLDKILQDAGGEVSSVASDVLGRSGRDMLDALVAGSRDPEVLAELARGQLRRKLLQLQAALEGRFSSHHALLVSEVLSLLDYLDESIGRLSVEIDRVIAPFAEHRDRLASAPGIDKRMAEAIIGEIGVDMTRFPTAAHLASWAGMCPGQRESAGKARHGTARHGNSWLQRHLAMAALSASRTKTTYLAAQYRRIAGRRGKLRARKAVGHSLLVGVWHILAEGVDWDDLGVDYYDRRQTPEHRARRKLAELRTLGWTVTTNHDGTTLLTPPVAA